MSDGPPKDELANLKQYYQFIEILPDEVKERVPRYRDPLTGDLRGFQYNNYVVLAEIHHLKEELGHVPTSNEMRKHGNISLPVFDRFGTFPRAVEAAGLEPEFTGTQEKSRYLADHEEIVHPDDLSNLTN